MFAQSLRKSRLQICTGRQGPAKAVMPPKVLDVVMNLMSKNFLEVKPGTTEDDGQEFLPDSRFKV